MEPSTDVHVPILDEAIIDLELDVFGFRPDWPDGVDGPRTQPWGAVGW